jgi:hypothetical protein
METTMTTYLSFAPEVIADNSGKFCGNALRFATEAEATIYVKDLERRWMLVVATRVVPSPEPVNRAIIDGVMVTVPVVE